jgi:hypothetical protein
LRRMDSRKGFPRGHVKEHGPTQQGQCINLQHFGIK